MSLGLLLPAGTPSSNILYRTAQLTRILSNDPSTRTLSRENNFLVRTCLSLSLVPLFFIYLARVSPAFPLKLDLQSRVLFNVPLNPLKDYTVSVEDPYRYAYIRSCNRL